MFGKRNGSEPAIRSAPVAEAPPRVTPAPAPTPAPTGGSFGAMPANGGVPVGTKRWTISLRNCKGSSRRMGPKR